MPVGNPATVTAGTTLLAAFWNAEVRDQFNAFLGAWMSYTPTWTGVTTNPANYSALGRYVQIGKLVVCNMQFSGTGSTTFGSGAYNFTLPVVANATSYLQFGSGRATANGGNFYATTPAVYTAAPTNILVQAPPSATASNIVTIGSSGLAGGAWGANFQINHTIIYEAA